MDQDTIRTTATRAAVVSKNLISRQVDQQAVSLGSTLSQTARDLEQIGSHLGDSSIGGAAQIAQRAADLVDRAATYLQSGNTDRFINDLEAFSRRRPWAVAASAAALGFVASRIVKSSSVRRYVNSDYTSDNNTADGYSTAS